VNVIAVIVTAVSLWRLCIGRAEGTPTLAAWIAVLLFFGDPFTWFNVYSGLETSFFTMLLVTALLAADRASRSRTHYVAPFVLSFLATLTRPEGALFALTLCVWLALSSRQPGESSGQPGESPGQPGQPIIASRAVRAFLLGFVLPAVVYAIWKYLYFGDLLPNSFYIKVAQPNAGHVSPFRGSGTLRLFYSGLWYLVVLGAVAFW
jgi:hypothetical protein